MNERHEWKHEISRSDQYVLRSRLRAVARPDPYAIGGSYRIRSLYFDDPLDTALREKTDGTDRREKFRLRYYNEDTSVIKLEKKSKQNGLCRKASVLLTHEETAALLASELSWMAIDARPLVRELYVKMTCRLLRPKTIVDYTREPFLFPAGNVRITIDDQLRTGIVCTDFLNPACATVPAGVSPILLEVKWDAYLPDIIRDAVGLENRHACAFSKYAACRIYG